jgi:hypothetical protein
VTGAVLLAALLIFSLHVFGLALSKVIATFYLSPRVTSKETQLRNQSEGKTAGSQPTHLPN